MEKENDPDATAPDEHAAVRRAGATSGAMAAITGAPPGHVLRVQGDNTVGFSAARWHWRASHVDQPERFIWYEDSRPEREPHTADEAFSDGMKALYRLASDGELPFGEYVIEAGRYDVAGISFDDDVTVEVKPGVSPRVVL